jgi:IS5 family transposase
MLLLTQRPTDLKVSDRARNPCRLRYGLTHQSRKRNKPDNNQIHTEFMKSGVAKSLTRSATSANVHDLNAVEELLTGEESTIFADAGYRGAERRTQTRATWQIAMRPGKRRVLTDSAKDRITDQLETLKARVRAKVEHPFRIIKIQFGFIKARYRGMAKNRAQLHMLFALANLYIVRRRLMIMG